jgi:hypothetical protein
LRWVFSVFRFEPAGLCGAWRCGGAVIAACCRFAGESGVSIRDIDSIKQGRANDFALWETGMFVVWHKLRDERCFRGNTGACRLPGSICGA